MGGGDDRHRRAARSPIRSIVFFFQRAFLNRHVGEFMRIEYLATLQAFDKFGIFFARQDANTGMFTGDHD